MNSEEFEGKNIDEAIARACERFSVPREKLNIEIISPGSEGLFGFLGARKAVVRAGLLKLDIPISGAKKSTKGPIPDLCETIKHQGPKEVTANGSQGARAKEILNGILQRMEFCCEVEVSEGPDEIVLNIKGEDGGLLIGKRGQNLDALQYLLNKSVNKSENGKPLVVDVEDYRRRREESLTNMARELAKKVKKTKKAITVNPMNAQSRRIIHLALKEDTEIATKSSGDGEYRKVIIMPAKKGKNKAEKQLT